MAVYNDSLNITPAAGISSKVSLNSSHLTTLDFGQIVPLYCQSLLPRDNFNIRFNIFSRVAPMNFPAYVDINAVAVTGYVPYYQVFDGADAYFTGTAIFKGKTPGLPCFSAYSLDQLFLTSQYNLVESTTKDAANIVVASSNSKYYKFTYKGRLFYKILRSLGYQLSSGIDDVKDDTDLTSYYYKSRRLPLNALRLLCFCKMYDDWFTSSFTYASSLLGELLEKIKHTSYTSNYTSWITTAQLYSLLDSIRLMYKNDYFTNAWRYTNAPVNNIGYTFSVPTSAGAGRSVVSNNNDTETGVYHPTGNFGYLTAMQVRSLNALDNFIRRNNYAGTKPAIRALAKFGIKTEDFKSNYADIIDIKRVPLNIGDVTQQSETNTSPLGSFAGKGIVNGEANVSVQCSDYGELFILGFLQVDTCYPQGYDRDILKTDFFDFYNPEFDGLGMQPISYNELVSDPSNSDFASGDDYVGDKVFGFTERYNEYRTSRDKITGDYLLFGELLSWHAGRQMMPFRLNLVNAQNSNFIYYPNDKQSEFDRIFALTDSANFNTPDHFYVTTYFSVNAVRPIKNSNQIANLGVGDVNIQKSGTHVE